jgi:hypothetical protein
VKPAPTLFCCPFPLSAVFPQPQKAHVDRWVRQAPTPALARPASPASTLLLRRPPTPAPRPPTMTTTVRCCSLSPLSEQSELFPFILAETLLGTPSPWPLPSSCGVASPASARCHPHHGNDRNLLHLHHFDPHSVGALQ